MGYQHFYKRTGRYCFLHRRVVPRGGTRYWFSYKESDIPDPVVDIPEGYCVQELESGWPVLKKSIIRRIL